MPGVSRMIGFRPPELQAAIDRLYEVFRDCPAGTNFCTFCWDPEELAHVTTAPVRDISEAMASKLLWETANHWKTAEVYKHYLPRMLDALAPLGPVEDLYPLHLFETLESLGFGWWQDREKEALHAFLDSLAPVLAFADHEEQEEWAQGCASLREGVKLVPPKL